MSEPEVIDADRERAAHVVANWSVNFGPKDKDVLRSMVATCLAAERARVRAPFQRLADEIEAACRGRQDVVSVTMRDDAALIRATLDDNQ